MGGRTRGAFGRFGRSGDTWDEGHGDVLDDDYGDYEEQVDMLLRTLLDNEERVKYIEKNHTT